MLNSCNNGCIIAITFYLYLKPRKKTWGASVCQVPGDSVCRICEFNGYPPVQAFPQAAPPFFDEHGVNFSAEVEMD
jgi:hypothetical protein